jgi:vitamin B12/bleomycin/antimicrobial peptide transport system ATP-binding/permease protein
MAEPSGEASSGSGHADVPGKDSLFSEVRRMATYFWASRERNTLVALGAGLIAITAATAYAQIRLNAWNRPFYDALTRKDVSGFIEQLGVFAGLASILLVLNVAQMWLNQMSKVVLRQGLVHDLLNEWLKPLRAFRLSNSGWMGVNPDQRLQADAQHLTELTTDLGIGLLQATLLLLSFIGVLWVLSQRMALPFAGRTLHVPGYMVWCALLYAGTASFLSWRVGRPLVALDAAHYAREADLRFALVRVNEEIEGVTIYGGEADEKAYLNRVFDTVLQVLRRIVGAMTRLTWVTAGYGWFTIVAPILVAAPSYLFGDMTFGELMMTVGAFNQVQTSLRWFVDNFSSIADWRATLLRVASFRTAVIDMDRLGATESRIELEETETRSIRLEDLDVAATEGCIRLSEKRVELKPGGRVLVAGPSGGARDLLFRAIIGLWPWGSGRITRPRRESMMFLPARAYVPPGMLRAGLSYPHSADSYDPQAISQALEDVGLERLLPLLDTTERWDRRLNDDEKQCLAFARVILQRPQWLVVNGAFDVLDPVSRARVEAVFSRELKDIGVLNIGQERPDDAFFSRRLRLITDATGPTFRPADRQVAPAG